MLVYEGLQSIYILQRLVIVNKVGNLEIVYKKKECLRFYQINLPTQLESSQDKNGPSKWHA